MRHVPALLVMAVLLAGCAEAPERPDGEHPLDPATQARLVDDGPHAFDPPVFDIAAAPDGGVLVAENTTIKRIDRGGVREVVGIPAAEGSAVNGLATVGRADFFATTAGQDRGVGAGLWRASEGSARLVADIRAFETENDPDANLGPGWKDPGCEALAGFTAGPQTNPYHLVRRGGGTALVADAAGNTLLEVRTDGRIEVAALFTPPEDEDGEWRVMAPLDADTDCYVQPVPTSVDIGPDGAYYVGELTGLTAGELAGEPAPGISRVWRIDPGAERPVVCPTGGTCEVVLSGLTSVIDVAFGPGGDLWVLEYDENGWFRSAELGDPAGGTLNRCDPDAGTCTEVETGLELPGAIAFDRRGELWLLESNILSPEVRKVGM